jgi:hypothetical protein
MNIIDYQNSITSVLNNEPADFLLATKQEDYLTYRISTYLTNHSAEHYSPTQFLRHDLVVLDNDGTKREIVEFKFQYSSDFSELYNRNNGIEPFRSDVEKLINVNSECFLVQYIIHFSKEDLAVWINNIHNPYFHSIFNNQTKYFPYINNANLRRFANELRFKNIPSLIYDGQYPETHIKEILSYGLPVIHEGHFKIRREVRMYFMGREIYIPHELYVFVWKIDNKKGAPPKRPYIPGPTKIPGPGENGKPMSGSFYYK